MSRLESSAFAYALSDDEETRIRTAASNALTQSFAVLTAERVLPRSRYQPWLRIARDYFGHAIQTGDQSPLAQALQAALPERFGLPLAQSVDKPWSYASALLEAAVAAATLADEPYATTSPSVAATIDDFIQKLRSAPRATVLQLVTDIGVGHRQDPAAVDDARQKTVEIANVRIIRADRDLERLVEQELPSAGYDVGRILVSPGPASLLVATVELVDDYTAGVNLARRCVAHLLAAIRLATASTAHPMIDIAGEPERVRWISPTITPLPSWAWDYRFFHRPVTIGEHDIFGLTNLVTMIDTWSNDQGWIAVRVALGRLSRSLDGWSPSIEDQVIDLTIGIEAMLGGNDRTEIAARLRTRAAHLLATNDDPPEAIYRDVKSLYDLRSAYVHGGNPSAKDLEKRITAITAPARSRWPTERYLLALDRWRDLLRRAILARIALTTADIPWALSTNSARTLDVDEYLLTEPKREAWRQHIRAYWAERGLPDAPNVPQGTRLTIGTS